MKLSDGIEQYVVDKHASGLAFERGESNLTALFRQVGDVDLGQVKTQQVLTYLNGSETGPITWRLKYRILFRFFDFWFSRGAMPELLMPPARAKVRQTFVPYVYTRAQLRALLKATAQNQNPLRSIDRQTLRTFILVLYATGALVGEVLSLKLFNDDGSLKMISEIVDHSAAALAGFEVCELFDGTGDQKHAYGLLKTVKLADKDRSSSGLLTGAGN